MSAPNKVQEDRLAHQARGRPDPSLPEPDLDDPDNPEWTEEDFARARGPEAMSEAEMDAFPRTRARVGRPKDPNAKVHVSLRLSPDVLEYFKAKGEGWQGMVNEALRQAMDPARR